MYKLHHYLMKYKTREIRLIIVKKKMLQSINYLEKKNTNIY